MSKAQVIRKRALDLVRDQNWPEAIKEYKRLVEIDQNNPNVHNELADLYLKTNLKNEAYDAFVRAIDEYVRVGLFNNAVAVCKKVLRVLPARPDMLVKLGFIRSRQGLGKEAESYYSSFLDKSATFDAEAFKKLAKQMADDVTDAPGLLERLSQALVAHSLSEEAADVLVKLVAIYEKTHDSAGSERARAGIEKLGLVEKLAALRKVDPNAPTVITEQNLWTKSHTEGERIQVNTGTQTTPTGSPAAPAPQPAGAAPGGPSERDLYLLRLARGSAEPRRPVATAPPPPAAETAASQSSSESVATQAPPAPPEVIVPEPQVETPAPEPEAPAPSPRAETKAPPTPEESTPGPNGSGTMHISALLDDELDGSNGETDYRSHYDLGMAYIEMELHAEAIREYQLAAKSPQYQVKCLEMIGLCFLKQNQAQLAIRQLTKGLSLIGNDSEESLGIKYNLGLAYEMISDFANARMYFEDVYVVDVTFRDVSDKVRRLAGTT